MMRIVFSFILVFGGFIGCTGTSDAVDDPERTIIEDLIGQMSLVEKVQQLSGPIATYPVCPDIHTCLSPTRGMWLSQGVPRLNIPVLKFSDGPRGLTATNEIFGARDEANATAFPVAWHEVQPGTWN